jgi:hypothetical protein
MMNYKGPTLATTAAAKAVADQHPFAQSAKSAKNVAAVHAMNGGNQDLERPISKRSSGLVVAGKVI